jgi:hypothetical protein
MKCTKCDRENLTRDDFNSNGTGGKRPECKYCQSDINKKWRDNHKNEIKEYHKNYYKLNYVKKDKSKIVSDRSAYKREWYHKKKEKNNGN